MPTNNAVVELNAQIAAARKMLDETRAAMRDMSMRHPEYAVLRAEELRLYREVSRLTIALEKLKYQPDNGAGWPSSFEQAAWDRKRGKVA